LLCTSINCQVDLSRLHLLIEQIGLSYNLGELYCERAGSTSISASIFCASSLAASGCHCRSAYWGMKMSFGPSFSSIVCDPNDVARTGVSVSANSCGNLRMISRCCSWCAEGTCCSPIRGVLALAYLAEDTGWMNCVLTEWLVMNHSDIENKSPRWRNPTGNPIFSVCSLVLANQTNAGFAPSSSSSHTHLLIGWLPRTR
jgi:hypothetical protein